ncbi:MAG: translation initiation factor IF-1 [Clostridia bacterium]|nr:translation initiation factor IF-1 [Clostridia bacterium]
MSKEDVIETEGEIVEALGNGAFKVKIVTGQIITAYISGKLRLHYIRVIEGDKVRIEMSPYDLTKGRITWRDKN